MQDDLQGLKDYLKSGKYLPDFLQDFHDQKLFFKRLDEVVQSRNDNYTKDLNWISAQVYTIDVFLHFMAVHGYTLQKSRKKVEFFDIYTELSEFEKKRREEQAGILMQALSNHINKTETNDQDTPVQEVATWECMDCDVEFKASLKKSGFLPDCPQCKKDYRVYRK